MAKIVVIGGTGFTGGNVVREAVRRGHTVTAVSRTRPAQPLEGVDYQTGDAAGVPALIAGADVVVGALSPRAGTEGTLQATYSTIAAQAAGAGARLFVVGGFSSLRPAAGAPWFAESGQIPEEFAAEATEVNSVREWLENDAPAELDWVFISPAAEYGSYLAQGEPRGAYRTGTDVALFDDGGKSVINGQDFAHAIVDEITTPAHHRTQVHFAY